MASQPERLPSPVAQPTSPPVAGRPYANLIRAARDARMHAYARYSGFRVGAAIQTKDGQIFAGCNVENASYGLTICAERVATASAIAQGSQRFVAVAIVSQGGVTPCGACRQFLQEFGDMTILLVDADTDDHVVERRLSDLLPDGFSL